jgi:hypothetical protein
MNFIRSCFHYRYVLDSQECFLCESSVFLFPKECTDFFYVSVQFYSRLAYKVLLPRGQTASSSVWWRGFLTHPVSLDSVSWSTGFIKTKPCWLKNKRTKREVGCDWLLLCERIELYFAILFHWSPFNLTVYSKLRGGWDWVRLQCSKTVISCLTPQEREDYSIFLSSLKSVLLFAIWTLI